jgi:hypothetical protein
VLGKETSCCIGAPISANRMYAMTTKGVFKTRKYRNWIDLNLPKLQTHMRPAQSFPVEVNIVIVQGKDWGPTCDPDNSVKPILDLLTRAGVIPDDSGKYIQKVNVRYMPLSPRGEALTRIEYKEPDSEVWFTDVERTAE